MAAKAGGLPLIRDLVAKGHYDWSSHVNERIEGGEFDEADLEACILSGTVHKTERDRLRSSVGDRVYVIAGRDTHGRRFHTAGKIIRSDVLLYFFVTAHQAE